MKSSALLLFLTLFTSEIHAQKVMEKSWDAQEIEMIQLISDKIFKIEFVTTQSNQIVATTMVEGEFNEEVVLQSEISDKALSLKPEFRPYFKKVDDKLAAHKVIAVEIKIRLPENMKIHVLSKSASVTIEGRYRDVFVGLNEGYCKVLNLRSNANLQTKDGNIYVEAHNSYAVAKSKSGKVVNKLDSFAKYKINVQSVNGLITLVKSQE